ncbi:hypothetical protein B0T14DRAFT_489554 [Immersiella caudata]|uniref:DUF6594 domain-containing protein n=1 Tax=Immersiella caudata TaxID=314043 RepID=A0AA39WCA6_9PEZI|nr:hypothetical protein B0T14DRAFT_489554 [Immersiella caudata]
MTETEMSTPPLARGYPSVASLMGKDGDLAIFRRFSRLNMISLLKLQAELLYLEKEYDEILAGDIQEGADFHANFQNLIASSEGSNSDQLDILIRIKDKVKDYNELLIQVQQIDTFNVPSSHSVSLLREWLRDSRGGRCFLQSTESFTWHADNEPDFVTFGERNRPQDNLTAWLTMALLGLYHRAWGHKGKDGVIFDPESGAIRYYSNKWWDRIGKALTTIMASTLPALVVLALYFENDVLKRIYIMIGVTAVLAMVLSLTTNAKRIEIFAAVATFAAVEIVFIGSVPSHSNSSQVA